MAKVNKQQYQYDQQSKKILDIWDLKFYEFILK